MGNFKEDIAMVEAIVLDVDGVMTDGGIIPTPDGDFIRRYNRGMGHTLIERNSRGITLNISLHSLTNFRGGEYCYVVNIAHQLTKLSLFFA